jgi:hypothetical protein
MSTTPDSSCQRLFGVVGWQNNRDFPPYKRNKSTHDSSARRLIETTAVVVGPTFAARLPNAWTCSTIFASQSQPLATLLLL